jgi:hypothetical protein
MFDSVLTLFLFVGAFPTPQSSVPSQTVLADALDWYSVWFAPMKKPLDPQTCQGELLDSKAIVRCDPLNAVIRIESNESGPCVITYVDPGISPEDGTRLLQPSLPQRRGGNTSPKPEVTFIGPDGTAKPFELSLNPSSLPPVDCYELPKNQRFLRFVLTPRARSFDEQLSARAREAVLSFAKQGGANSCTFRYPRVKSGDPFIHVYEECADKLEEIIEFRVNGRQVLDHPYRFYDAPFRTVPAGVEWRVKAPELWFTP